MSSESAFVPKKIGIVGAGSFGSCLAITLQDKGHEIHLYGRNKNVLDEIKTNGTNQKYLPSIKFDSKINLHEDMKEVIIDMDYVIFAVPSQIFREVFSVAHSYICENTIVVNVAKGIENGTMLRMSEVASSINNKIKYVVLSGPSHAEEIAQKLPTTVVVASENKEYAVKTQEDFITENLRIYTNDDITGIEYCGALKNVIALGAGISDGLGFGDNAKAAIMTRGINEISVLAQNLGASMITFFGLAGIGDLIVTCMSKHSRNRKCGQLIGEGTSAEDAIGKIGMVVEGITATKVAYEMAKKYNVEMPIIETLYNIIEGKIDAKQSITLLMTRDKKDEMHRIVNAKVEND